LDNILYLDSEPENLGYVFGDIVESGDTIKYYGRNKDNDHLREKLNGLIPMQFGDIQLSIDNDPAIIPLDIGFINKYILDIGGVFGDLEVFYCQLMQIDRLILIRKLNYQYLFESKDKNKRLNYLSVELGKYRYFNRACKGLYIDNNEFYQNIFYYDPVHVLSRRLEFKVMKYEICFYIEEKLMDIFKGDLDEDYRSKINANKYCKSFFNKYSFTFEQLEEMYKKYSEIVFDYKIPNKDTLKDEFNEIAQKDVYEAFHHSLFESVFKLLFAEYVVGEGYDSEYSELSDKEIELADRARSGTINLGNISDIRLYGGYMKIKKDYLKLKKLIDQK
jgi:hypothetical protein